MRSAVLAVFACAFILTGCESEGMAIDEELVPPPQMYTEVIAPDGFPAPLLEPGEVLPRPGPLWCCYSDNVWWEGKIAKGEAKVTIGANRVRLVRTMTVGNQTFPSQISSDGWALPRVETFKPAPLSYNTSKSCGEVANMTTNFEVKVVALVSLPFNLTTLDSSEGGGTKGANQPDCGCPDGSIPVNGQCPPNPPVAGPVSGGGGGSDDGPCPPDVIVCECWEEWAWFMWIDGVWTQVSESWWEPCDGQWMSGAQAPLTAKRRLPDMSQIRKEYRDVVQAELARMKSLNHLTPTSP